MSLVLSPVVKKLQNCEGKRFLWLATGLGSRVKQRQSLYQIIQQARTVARGRANEPNKIQVQPPLS
jgi:hypothetical protein